MAWKTSWAVSVNGVDASETMNSRLRSIKVTEKEGDGGDAATLEFDDSGGSLYLPRAGARVGITLDGVQKFDGWTEEPEWTHARGSGRTFNVHCIAHDSRGAVKDPQHWHMDGGSLQDFLSRAAKEAGLSGISVAQAFAGMTRDWWSPDGANFQHLGRRFAAELGGLFRIRGDKAVLAERGTGTGVSGASMPAVIFDCADGSIVSVRATPFAGHENRSKVRMTWFDREQARWRTEDTEIEPLDGAPDSVAHGRFPRADADTAKRAGKGRKDTAAHDKGGATVKCDLRVRVSVGAPATIANARPGVDGEYKVKSCTHSLDRSGGGASDFELGRPDGEAGKDGRKSGSSSSSSSSSGTQEAGAASGSSVA